MLSKRGAIFGDLAYRGSALDQVSKYLKDFLKQAPGQIQQVFYAHLPVTPATGLGPHHADRVPTSPDVARWTTSRARPTGDGEQQLGIQDSAPGGGEGQGSPEPAGSLSCG